MANVLTEQTVGLPIDHISGTANGAESWASNRVGEQYAGATKSGNVFCKIEIAGNVVTKSETEGFEEWTTLASMNILDITRQTNPNPTNDKVESGRVIVQNTPLLIPHEGNSIDLMKALIDGSQVNVYVTRIGHFKGEQRLPIEEYTFTNCAIQRLQDKADMLSIVYRATIIKKIINSYDKEGTKLGAAVCTYDLALNKVE
jgi:type VI protein secretion system component Hcp